MKNRPAPVSALLGPSWVSFCGLVLASELLFVPTASAIIIRHDVDDANYVVSDADYPALVDLIEPGDCIGTLVEASFLLTVAHCAVDLTVGQSFQIGGSAHAVAEVILHPNWVDEDQYDIALVRLEQPVVNVDPLPIYRGSDELGALIILVGRGVTANGQQGEAAGASDGQLRRATNVVTAVDAHTLEVVFETPGSAGVTALEGVGAAGDSGCPVFIEAEGAPYIAGLNSFGDGVAGGDVGEYGGVDYQTRISQYLPWLDGLVDFPVADDVSDDDVVDAGTETAPGADAGAEVVGDPFSDGGQAIDAGPGDDESPLGEVDAGQAPPLAEVPCADAGGPPEEEGLADPGAGGLCAEGNDATECGPGQTTPSGCAASLHLSQKGPHLGLYAAFFVTAAMSRGRRRQKAA